MVVEGLEAKLEGIPDRFQDIIYSDFFPSHLYSSLEIKAIHWHELRVQQRWKGRERKMGGPAYRHIREIVEYMLKFNQTLSQNRGIFEEALGKENIFRELKEGMEQEEGVLVREGLIQMPIIAYFSAIFHDDLEDDEEINGLAKQYKRLKGEKERADRERKKWWRLRGGKKEKEEEYREKREAFLKTKRILEKKREAYFDQRSYDFRDFLRGNKGDKKKGSDSVKREILNQFRICERVLDSLTRHIEEESYINSMYYFFAKIPGNSDKDVLVKAFTKLCDRLVNLKDTKREYSEEEIMTLRELFGGKAGLRKKYGEMSFEQREAGLDELIYSAGKSVIVLNSLNRWVLNSKIPKRVRRRGYPGEKYFLYLVLLAKEELLEETRRLLKEKKEEMESKYPRYISEEYIKETKGRVALFREKGGYDKITSQKKEGKKKMFGHGTLELITNKPELRKYLGELTEEKKIRFLYLTTCNCLEVISDFGNGGRREYGRGERYNNPARGKYHTIKGLTNRLRPLEVVS